MLNRTNKSQSSESLVNKGIQRKDEKKSKKKLVNLNISTNLAPTINEIQTIKI